MRSNLLLACLLAAAYTSCVAQDTLTSRNIATWQPTWRFAEGDDAARSAPEFDDQSWKNRDGSWFDPGLVDSTGWQGFGWFRAGFMTDASVSGTPIAYTISLGGAAELYLDGTLVGEFGHPSSELDRERPVRLSTENPEFGLLPSMLPGRHFFAVRVSNFVLSDQGETAFGFRLHLGEARAIASRLAHQDRLHAAKTFGLSGIAAALAIIYLLLFLYQPKHVKNLLFLVLSALVGFVIFAELHSRVVPDVWTYLSWRRYMEIAAAVAWIVAVRLVRVSFFKESWKLFYALTALAGIVALHSYFDPIGGRWSVVVLSVLASVELVRRIGLAVFLSRPGALVVGFGAILLILGGLFDYVTYLGWIGPVLPVDGMVHFGMVGFLVLTAFYLAIDSARMNRTLEIKVAQVRREGDKALQEEKINQAHRIDRIQAELDNRRKELEQEKEREVDIIRKSLTVGEEHVKEMKNRLVHAEAVASLGKLASGIAHDVSDLLSSIANLTTLSQDLTAELEHDLEVGSGKGQAPDLIRQLRRNLARINEQNRTAGQVIEDILKHASKGAQKDEAVDLNALIDRYLNLTMHAARGDFPDMNIVVERVFDERVGNVVVPVTSLGRALMGVFRNAIEALAENRESSKADFQPTVTVSTQRLENAVLIRVRDNGPGVRQELRDKIFEPFFSTSSEKTGLGLAIAQQTVTEKLDGTFGLEHFNEQGAGFYITIPLTPKGPKALAEEPGSEGPAEEPESEGPAEKPQSE